MAKVKGLKKLNKCVSKVIAPFGIKKAKFGNEYAYYFDKNIITYSIVEDETDTLFNDFVRERFGYDVENIFIISLLHEIGHAKANNQIKKDIYQFCISEKERIQSELALASDEEERALYYQYFSLPDEIMATQWAVNYAKNHPKKIKKMWEKCKKGFHEFYGMNEVE